MIVDAHVHLLPGRLAEKVRAYRVTGERSGQARIDVARERGFTRLVGRERELALLRQCFELAQGGRGQAVSIIGDAGLGKSRLLYECRQALAGHDCAWLDGRCHPYGAALAYGVLSARGDIALEGEEEEEAPDFVAVPRGQGGNRGHN